MAENAEESVNGAFDRDIPTPHMAQNHRIEVAIPEMSLQDRDEYDTVHSNVVESVISEVPLKEGEFCYKIEYTDGREDLVSEDPAFTCPSPSISLFCMQTLVEKHSSMRLVFYQPCCWPPLRSIAAELAGLPVA
jgi:hypothetical protein